MEEDDLTPEEQREAEALALALERGRASPGLPQDALETAALLRYAQDGGELDPRRQAEILDEVVRTARVRRQPTESLWQRLRWPFGLIAAAASSAAAAWLVFAPFGRSEAIALPAPPASLFAAQAAAATKGADIGALDREMQGYRVAVYDALGGAHE
jgi:hypothetical protein